MCNVQSVIYTMLLCSINDCLFDSSGPASLSNDGFLSKLLLLVAVVYKELNVIKLHIVVVIFSFSARCFNAIYLSKLEVGRTT